MILTDRDRHTGLPLIQETRSWNRQSLGLPRHYGKLAAEVDTEGVPWYPQYLEWTGPVLERVRCWKCGTDLMGWRPVIDQYGQLVIRGEQQCSWLRPFDHFRQTPYYVHWGALGRFARFHVLHCADCQLKPEDGQHVVMCLLAGHSRALQRQWEVGRENGVDKDAWASYNYRWSPQLATPCEPVGTTMPATKQPIAKVHTAGQIMAPSDYILWDEQISGSSIPSGVVVEYVNAEEPPPGWMMGPRPGTIQKR